MERSNTVQQSAWLVASFGVVGGFNLGYNQNIISTAKDLILEQFGITPKTILDGMIIACVLIGGMLGSLGGGLLMSRYGRRVANMIGCGLCLLGTATAFAPDSIIFYIFRAIMGAGLGLTAVVCPAYVNDMAETSMKGVLGVIFQIFITIGIFISFLVGWGLSVPALPLQDEYRWRVMMGSGCIFPVILFIQTWIWMLPESDQIGLQEETDLMVNAGAPKASLRGLISDYKFQLLTATVLAATLQLTGINAVMFYGPTIMKEAGFSNGNLLNLAIGGWNFLTTLVAVGLIRKVGRQFLMIFGTALMTLALIGIGITFTLTEACPTPNATLVGEVLTEGSSLCPRVLGVSIGLALFLLGFEAGPGCLFWVLANEIFPRAYNEMGASYTNIAQWGFNLLVSLTFAIMPQEIAFYVFGGVGAFCTLYLVFALRDQKSSSSSL